MMKYKEFTLQEYEIGLTLFDMETELNYNSEKLAPQRRFFFF